MSLARTTSEIKQTLEGGREVWVVRRIDPLREGSPVDSAPFESCSAAIFPIRRNLSEETMPLRISSHLREQRDSGWRAKEGNKKAASGKKISFERKHDPAIFRGVFDSKVPKNVDYPLHGNLKSRDGFRTCCLCEISKALRHSARKSRT